MKKIWKWILGIVIVLVVLAAVGFVARGFFITPTVRVERFNNARPPMTNGFDRENWRSPMHGFDRFPGSRGNGYRGMPMYGGRGVGGYRYMPLPFMLFGGFLRLIFPLAILAAVVYFAYQKGKKDGMAAVSVAPAPPAENAPESAKTPKRKGRKVAEEN